VTLKEQIEQYHRCLAEFNRWEAKQVQPSRPAEAILADLGFLLSWVSEEDLARDPDPQKLGIQSMRAKLARAFGSQ
jgi:hypothetical protein